ncbi:hypothetical protein GYB29_07535 [bacterium]|nr:hypothetical protein [bacterium]
MDIGTSIISILGIGILIGPFVLSAVRQGRNSKSLYQELKSMVGRVDCSIGQSEVCNNKIIGLDTNRNFIFFFKRLNGNSISSEIKLNELDSCTLSKKVQTFQKGSSTDTYINQITLNFTFKNKAQAPIIWILFDFKEENQISDELVWGKRWETEINKIVKDKI